MATNKDLTQSNHLSFVITVWIWTPSRHKLVIALVNSSAESNFVDDFWAKSNQVEPTSHHLKTIQGFEGYKTCSFTQFNLAVETTDTKEASLEDTYHFHSVKLVGYDMILGFPWLKAVNPLINWQEGEFILWTTASPENLDLSTEDAANKLLAGATAYLCTVTIPGIKLEAPTPWEEAIVLNVVTK
ncbi:hypothetical protein FQN55_004772 [Onygenales sp. PD_40]|nr:hypothetical protein FQN55_004772 [Onygenales sp. PD_40]